MSGAGKLYARLRQDLALIRGSLMESLAFRASAITRVIANFVYLIIIYFLWRAIYDSSPTEVVNGMTFYDTMVYLVLASAMFNVLDAFIVWEIGRAYQKGELVLCLVRPISYQRHLFFGTIGGSIMLFVTTFLPTFVIVYLITRGSFALGLNLLFFLISMCFSFIINFCVDFLVGTICLYTQSIWGVNVMKEVVVSLLSGATIPLAFFPEKLRQVVNMLPFQAIYHTPLRLLTGRQLALSDYLQGLCVQLFWVVMLFGLGRLFWNRSMKNLTVNGG